MKSMIKKAKLSDHKEGVKLFNTWFESTRDAIITEEGTGYKDYKRMHFQAYLTLSNNEFVIAIKMDERRWIQDTLPDYIDTDLLELGCVTFKNLPDANNCVKVVDNE